MPGDGFFNQTLFNIGEIRFRECTVFILSPFQLNVHPISIIELYMACTSAQVRQLVLGWIVLLDSLPQAL